MRYDDDQVPLCASMSLKTTGRVEAMLLASATSSARREARRRESGVVSELAANPHPSPTRTRTPTARSTVEERCSTSPLRTRTCCCSVTVCRTSAYRAFLRNDASTSSTWARSGCMGGGLYVG
jgi:hypothetical protein